MANAQGSFLSLLRNPLNPGQVGLTFTLPRLFCVDQHLWGFLLLVCRCEFSLEFRINFYHDSRDQTQISRSKLLANHPPIISLHEDQLSFFWVLIWVPLVGCWGQFSWGIFPYHYSADWPWTSTTVVSNVLLDLWPQGPWSLDYFFLS